MLDSACPRTRQRRRANRYRYASRALTSNVRLTAIHAPSADAPPRSHIKQQNRATKLLESDYQENSINHIGMRMKKSIFKALSVGFVTFYCGIASACLPPRDFTVYFGNNEYLTPELRQRVMTDMFNNGYRVIEEQIGLFHFAIIKKGRGIYIGDKAVATDKDSFWYLGRGYYQLNREIYYMGKKVGQYPIDGSVVTYEEPRTEPRPETISPNQMYCPTVKHANILETSEGLRAENIVYDN
jgi:hypothetical protein